MALAAVLTNLRFDLLDHGLQGQLCIPGESNVNGKVLIDVFDTLDIVDDDLTIGDGLSVAGSGHTRSNGEEHVGFLQPSAGRQGRGAAPGAQGKGMPVIER